MFYVTGDMHGDADDLNARAEAVDAGAGDEVLVLGDVGLMYGTRSDGLPWVSSKMVELMRRVSWTLVVMRGNHDTRYERDLLQGGKSKAIGFGRVCRVEWNDGPAFQCESIRNIVFLQDAGGLYNIDDVSTLVVPGAYSADKAMRLEHGYPWEPEEQLTNQEMNCLLNAANENQIECVLSHTCPLEWQRSWLRDLLMSGKIDANNTMERWMNELLHVVEPSLKKWAFGHYHDDRSVGFGKGRLVFRDVAEYSSLVAGTLSAPLEDSMSNATCINADGFHVNRFFLISSVFVLLRRLVSMQGLPNR